ncbi:uncharacterized protein AB675_7298 [Cyphellophora attinorum]|uniref:Uncharacterized protein n=1 Tax=Cyphellophora attinorum TaxID=1664694 RepID=A0A0N1GZ63_9EURO|nr:uncharacterized protein AB675_7298 [Phialophora attinorum]KPI36335.1 hypothetical protein AB675_7298 [Phialophora attinorum]
MVYSLLDLPEEVRRMIYRWLFRSQVFQWQPRFYRRGSISDRNNYNIILANKLIHAESQPMLLAVSTIFVPEAFERLYIKGLMYFSALALPRLQHLELCPGELCRMGMLLPSMSSLRTLEVNTLRLAASGHYPYHVDYRTYYFREHKGVPPRLGFGAIQQYANTFDRLCGRHDTGKASDLYDGDMLAILSYWMAANARFDLILVSKVVLREPKPDPTSPSMCRPDYRARKSWTARTNFATETMSLINDSTLDLDYKFSLVGIKARITEILETEYF